LPKVFSLSKMKSGGYFNHKKFLRLIFVFRERTLSEVNGKMGHFLLDTTLTKYYSFSNYAIIWIHKILDKSQLGNAIIINFTCNNSIY